MCEALLPNARRLKSNRAAPRQSNDRDRRRPRHRSRAGCGDSHRKAPAPYSSSIETKSRPGRWRRNAAGSPLSADVTREDRNPRIGRDRLRTSSAGSICFVPTPESCRTAVWKSATPNGSEAWEINFLSHVYAARAVIPRMLEQGSGYLLQTASAAGLLTQIGAAPYSVTKHAAVAFAEWLSITYHRQGLRVSCLCPQGVHTRMLDDSASAMADVLRPSALTPEQVADAVVEGLAEERFLILPHPEVATYFQHKANDNERWLRAMRRLWDKCRTARRTAPARKRPMSRLILVRHAQASFFSDNYDQLSPLGESQARALGEHWLRLGISFDEVIVGPRERQIRTEQIVRSVYDAQRSLLAAGRNPPRVRRTLRGPAARETAR